MAMNAGGPTKKQAAVPAAAFPYLFIQERPSFIPASLGSPGRHALHFRNLLPELPSRSPPRDHPDRTHFSCQG